MQFIRCYKSSFGHAASSICRDESRLKYARPRSALMNIQRRKKNGSTKWCDLRFARLLYICSICHVCYVEWWLDICVLSIMRDEGRHQELIARSTYMITLAIYTNIYTLHNVLAMYILWYIYMVFRRYFNVEFWFP